MKPSDIVCVSLPPTPLTDVSLSDRDDYWGVDRLIFRPITSILYGKPTRFYDDDHTHLQMEYSVAAGGFSKRRYHMNKTNGKCYCGEKFCYELGIWEGDIDHLWVNERFLKVVKLRLDYLKIAETKRTEQRQKAAKARHEKKAKATSTAI